MIPLPGSSPSSSIPLPGGDAQIPPPGAAAIPLPGSVPAPSLTTQAPGQGQYYVKDSGGRVLGPMPRAMVEELLKKGAIKADFEMRRTESAPWVPLSQETSFLPFLRSPGVGASSAERSITLEDAALPLLLLDLVRHGRTGNLRVIADGNDWTFQIKRGAIPFVNVTAGGPRLGDYLISEGIIDVATAQQALRLCGEQNAPFRTVLVNLGAISAAQDTASVTSWVQRLLDVACRAGSGAATFTGAPSADDDVDARADGLGQVRMAFDPARGFPVDVLQARLGEAQTVLRLTRELAPPGLTEGEQMAMERADGRTLGELVGELDAAGMDIGSAVAAVFMLVGLVVVERASSPSQSALAALRDQLGVNPDPFAALGVGRPDDVAAVMGALQLVSDEFARAAAGVAPHDPVRVQVEERLARIRSRVSSPLERHIYARAKGMGLDPESPAVRPVLEAEFLAKTVPQLLDGGQTARAHLLAERYYAIVPEDPTAIAFVGRCRFATAEDDSLKTEAVDFLIAQRDRFPTSIDIQLAVGVTGLAAGRMGTAKKALEFLTDKAGKDARVLAFQAKVQEAVSGRAPAVEQTSVKEVLEAAGS